MKNKEENEIRLVPQAPWLVWINPGELDWRGMQVLGATAKPAGDPARSPWGRFGSGLKAAAAVVARHGGRMVVASGTEVREVVAVEEDFRGKKISRLELVERKDGWDCACAEEDEELCLPGLSLPVTSEFCSTWEPWMVLRELGANAQDEGGSFMPKMQPDLPTAAADFTWIAVQGEEFFDAAQYSYKWCLPAGAQPNWSMPGLEIFQLGVGDILPEACPAGVYLRGVLVCKTYGQWVFNWPEDLPDGVGMADDRTVSSGCAEQALVCSLLRDAPQDCVEAMLRSTSNISWPSYFSWSAYAVVVEPSDAWLEAARGLQAEGKLGWSAAQLLRQHAPEVFVVQQVEVQDVWLAEQLRCAAANVKTMLGLPAEPQIRVTDHFPSGWSASAIPGVAWLELAKVVAAGDTGSISELAVLVANAWLKSYPDGWTYPQEKLLRRIFQTEPKSEVGAEPKPSATDEIPF
jgi:hypothetical protein